MPVYRHRRSVRPETRDGGDGFERRHGLPAVFRGAVEAARILGDDGIAEALHHALEGRFGFLAALRGGKQGGGGGPQRRAGLAAWIWLRPVEST